MGRRSDAILRLIAVFKLVKGTMLLVFGVGALMLAHGAFAEDPRGWVDQLAPSHRLVRHVAGRLAELNPHTLEMVGIFAFVYAAVFFVEGTGLLLKKVWAEYATTIITISFVPIEIYEAAHRFTIVKLVVIVANIGIVVYLVWRLRREHHWPFRSR